MNKLYPVQIQADNKNANDTDAVIMCHVFDIKSEICTIAALQNMYLQVTLRDKEGTILSEYDNR